MSAVIASHLVYLLVLIFTVVLLYPFLPGSGSPIFGGVSVFVGALLTFGARNSVDNLVAGLVLTFNRTFEVGDRVQVGSVLGDVIELGAFITGLRTLENEMVAIPNSVIMQSEITNLSEGNQQKVVLAR